MPALLSSALPILPFCGWPQVHWRANRIEDCVFITRTLTVSPPAFPGIGMPDATGIQHCPVLLAPYETTSVRRVPELRSLCFYHPAAARSASSNSLATRRTLASSTTFWSRVQASSRQLTQ